MTGPRPPGQDADGPPDRGPRATWEHASRDQAARARLEREQAQEAAVSRIQGWRHGAHRRIASGPAPRTPVPLTGVPPGGMFPAEQDATVLIHRITDEAVPPDVAEAVGVGRPGEPGSAAPRDPRDPPDGAGSAAAGMKTASTAGVVRAGALMAVATIVSRLTGLLSKVAMLAILGAGLSSSAYTVANTLPNIVFELLIGGVLTSVAIPLLTRAQRSDPDGGQEYTQRLLTIAVVGLLLASVAAVFCAPLLARLYLSDGQEGDGRLTALTTQLGRLLLPQIFFYGVAALFGAILNTKERFAANAWAPVLNNVVVIGVAVVLFVDTGGRAELVDGLPTRDLIILGVGTTLGIAVQALAMVPSLRRSGFRFRWRWGWDPRLGEAGGLVGWAVGYVLISQVGVVVTTRVARDAFVDGSGPTIFSYASLLFQMPYGILGVAVLTAIMPRLSRHAAEGQMAQVKHDVSLANRLSAVALLPVSAALVVLGGGVSVLLFEHGNVTNQGAAQIGLSIAGMAIGLVPLAMTLVQMRVFYAMKDGRTPTIINAVMVGVRVPLLLASVSLAPHWVIPGLALSTAVSYIVGAVVGEIWLRVRFGRMGTVRTLTTIAKMTAASALGAVAAFVAVHYTVGASPTTFTGAIQTVVVGTVVGLVVIAAAATALRVEELQPVRHRLSRLLGRHQVAAAGFPVSSGMVSAEGTTRAGMKGSPDRPPPGPAGDALHGVTQSPGGSTSGPDGTPSREKVTERVTHAGAGDPREPSEGSGHQAAVPPAGRPDDGALPGAVGSTRRPGAHARAESDPTVNLGARAAAGPPAVQAPGTTVGGRYRLVSLVATDDAGNRFWRAKDTVLPRDMAVTLLPDTNAASATVARTLRVGRLHHIGLPQTLDVGTEQGHSYVVGQWVDGATLTDLLAGGPLEPDVATSITAKVSEAVAEAHRNGIALGAINPSLVRVNFDGQVRLSHVIAHGNATPDQDVRAVGGLLYLMLTGTWPLPAGAASAGVMGDGVNGRSAAGLAGSSPLTPAPTRGGREIPAGEIRAGIPPALSALAQRALHPDEVDGIHAVGAIAALLRQPELTAPPPAGAVDEPVQPTLNPAERRLVKERRAKLAVATVMIAAFSALIIIVVASLAKQVMDKVAGPTVTGVQILNAGPVTTRKAVPAPVRTTAKPTPTPTGATKSSSPTATPTTTAAPVATVQKIIDANVYDPMGNGVKDNTDQVPQAFDGNPSTSWPTFAYKQQFPSALKPGVGLTLEFADPITPATVTVSSDTPLTTIEVRAAAAPDLPYTQTTALGQGDITTGSNATPGSTTITLTAAPKSKFLVIFVVHMGPDGSRFRSDINEITVTGS